MTHVHTKFGEELASVWATLAQPPLAQKPQALYKKVLLNRFLRLGTSLGLCFPSSTLNGSFWLPGFPFSCLLLSLSPALQPYNIQLAVFGFHLPMGPLRAPRPHSHPACSEWPPPHFLRPSSRYPAPSALICLWGGNQITQCPRSDLHSSLCPQRSITRH